MLKSFITFAVLLIVLCVAHAADPTADVPHLPPQHSTAFVCEVSGRNLVVAVSVSYSTGAVLRFDADHMHGLTVAQLMAYHDTAPDSQIYIVRCIQPVTT